MNDFIVFDEASTFTKEMRNRFTNKQEAAMKRKATFELHKTARGTQRWLWRLVGGNGEIIASSAPEKFDTRAKARRAMNRAIEIISDGDYEVAE